MYPAQSDFLMGWILVALVLLFLTRETRCRQMA